MIALNDISIPGTGQARHEYLTALGDLVSATLCRHPSHVDELALLQAAIDTDVERTRCRYFAFGLPPDYVAGLVANLRESWREWLARTLPLDAPPCSRCQMAEAVAA